ncbi:MAG: ATP-dependent DNA helicase [Saprospiraceae bacterium]
MSSGSQLALDFASKARQDAHFQEALDRLNQQQRDAVDRIDGPVLVVAGPGTGKTQILALRIGNILQKTDTTPANILCLTYTEAGVFAMRQRLLEYIGPTAYQIQIHTFHSFGNRLIQQHRELFGAYRDLQPASELELVTILRELIDQLENDHPLKRLRGDQYFDVPRLQHLFQHMKKENLDAPEFIAEINDEIHRYREDPDSVSSRGVRAGQLKKEILKRIASLETTIHAAGLLPRYRIALLEHHRYDYEDMIQWVLQELKRNEALLASIQEQYLYVLVDEYQDTNGAQNAILETICPPELRPNLFVVGDDDQAIYRFQGANVENIMAFSALYKPSIVLLTGNYRSAQRILDAAGLFIEANAERLVHLLEIEKNLIASGINHQYPGLINILHFPNRVQEEIGILNEIKRLRDEEQVPLSDIAVIYRNHKQVEDLIEVMEQNLIPLSVKRKVNLLHLAIIRNLRTILTYLQEEFEQPFSREYLLFEIMHYSYFGIAPIDIARIAKFQKDHKEHPTSWREVIQNMELLQSCGVEQPEPIIRLAENLDRWMRGIQEETLQNLFEQILKEGRILQEVLLSSERLWLLQVLTSFFEFIKSEMVKQPTLSLGDFLDMIGKMDNHAIPLELVRVIHAEEGVNFMTAHGAKGLEFGHVFVIGCSHTAWEGKSGGAWNQFRFPSSKTKEEKDHGLEDERRLFYVAMTRAKKSLYLSYPAEDEKGNSVQKSQFLSELIASTGLQDQLKTVDAGAIQKYYTQLLLPESRPFRLLDHDWIDHQLRDLTISPTSLNKFLRCPLTFYFEQILRVPTARTDRMGFGKAVHYALEHFHRHFKKDQSLESLLHFFLEGMERHQSHFTVKQFEEQKFHGEQVLRGYYAARIDGWKQMDDWQVEYRIKQVELAGVPISGIIDKIEIDPGNLRVVDYKTGRFYAAKLSPPKQENESGGDYWRQIVFYKLLLDQMPDYQHRMQEGIMDFVIPDNQGKFTMRTIKVTPDDEKTVTQQLTDAYAKIKSHAFYPGCGEEDCYWCALVNHHFDIHHVESLELEREEIDETD